MNLVCYGGYYGVNLLIFSLVSDIINFFKSDIPHLGKTNDLCVLLTIILYHVF